MPVLPLHWPQQSARGMTRKDAHRCKALQVHHPQEVVWCKVLPDGSREDSHWREALQVRNLWERVRGFISICQAQKDARRRLPLHLPHLSERLLGQGQSSSSPLCSTRVVLMRRQFVLEAQRSVSGNGHV